MARSILEQANATALAAGQAISDRTNLTAIISEHMSANDQWLNSLNSSIGALWGQLELARQAAASVSPTIAGSVLSPSHPLCTTCSGLYWAPPIYYMEVTAPPTCSCHTCMTSPSH